ncbi:MAG: terpene synthase family protein [Dehalococcoidia bacterium]
MQLQEVIGVLEHIDQFSGKHNLPAQYKRLVNALNQARKKPSSETTAKIIQQREKIRAVHDAAEPDKWGRSGQQLYEKLGATELIGMKARDRIDHIFQTYEADPNGIIQAMEELAEQTSQLVEHIHTLNNGLKPLLGEGTENPPDTTTLQILFPVNGSAPTLQNLEESLQNWDRVISAFSRLTRQPAEDSIILNIEQNPLVVDVAVPHDITSAIGKATCEVLEVHKKYLNIKRVSLEVDNLELRNRGVAEQLNKEADLLIRNTASDVTRALMDDFGWAKESSRNDVHNLVNTAVTTIFEFIKEDGQVDIREAGDHIVSPIQKQMVDAFAHVHSLEEQIARLISTEGQEKISQDNPSLEINQS